MADPISPEALLTLTAAEAASRLTAAGEAFSFVESVAPRASGEHPERGAWRVVRALRREAGLELVIVPAVPLPAIP